MGNNEKIERLVERAVYYYNLVMVELRKVTPHQWNVGLKIANFVLPVAGLIIMIWGFVVMALTSMTTDWPVAKGKITSVNFVTKRGIFSRSETVTLSYSYKIEKMIYESSTISMDGRSNLSKEEQHLAYTDGAEVNVYFDPNDPSRAVLEHQIMRGGSRAFYGFLMIAAAIPFYMIRTRLRYRLDNNASHYSVEPTNYGLDAQQLQALDRQFAKDDNSATEDSDAPTPNAPAPNADSAKLAEELWMSLHEGTATLESATDLINQGADVMKRFRDKRSMLHEAVRKAPLEVVSLFLQYPELINAQDASGTTPLMLVLRVERGDTMDIVEALLSAGADVSVMDNLKMSALTYAFDGFTDSNVIARLAPLSDLAAQDYQGRNALLFALAKNAREEDIELLLKLGAEPNSTDDKGKNAYDYAAALKDKGKRLEILKKYKAAPPAV